MSIPHSGAPVSAETTPPDADLERRVRRMRALLETAQKGRERFSITANDLAALLDAVRISPPRAVSPPSETPTRWRCKCGRLNEGVESCQSCGAAQHEPFPSFIMTPEEARTPPVQTDTEDRYPEVQEFEQFDVSERFPKMLMQLVSAAQRTTWESEHGINNHGAINAMSNAEGDILTAIAELERGAKSRSSAAATTTGAPEPGTDPAQDAIFLLRGAIAELACFPQSLSRDLVIGRLGMVLPDVRRVAASAEAWKAYASHLEHCATCAEDGIESCDVGARLRAAAGGTET